MLSLYHHGIKGQKWGVRRYQNKDGTLTPAGKERVALINKTRNSMQTTDDANAIVKTLSSKEKKLLGAPKNGDWIDKKYDAEYSSNIAKRFIEKHGDTPVSFLEVWDNGGTHGEIAIATNSDKQYRGKGYASKNVDKAVKWFEQYGNKKLDDLIWEAKNENEASINLAKKKGFQVVDSKDYTEDMASIASNGYTILQYKKRKK